VKGATNDARMEYDMEKIEPAPMATAPSDGVPGRRNFFRWFTALAAAVASLLVTLPVVGYIFKPRRRMAQWISLGRAADFPANETRMVTFDNPLRQSWDGITAHTGVYVCNEQEPNSPTEHFRVLAVNCAHLGCPVSWFPQSGLFMCPCHGGVYSADGERASGPPPRGLFHVVWRVRDGELQIEAPHYPTLQDPLDDSKTT
jgi:Rieske Fe-S protein